MSSQQEEKFKGWQQEINGYFIDMANFTSSTDAGVSNLKDIMEKLAGISARAVWLRSVVVKSNAPEYKRFRIDQLDPLINEASNQFKIWSRYASLTKDEYEMSKG